MTIAATKDELAQALHERFSITKRDSLLAVDTVFDTLCGMLQAGKPVHIAGFGRLVVKRQASRKARNPKTGEAVQVPERNVVLFRPSQVLKARVALRDD